ncbi:MAG: transglutaminase-like cysteine peptidase [Paracoccaceae bacterium]
MPRRIGRAIARAAGRLRAAFGTALVLAAVLSAGSAPARADGYLNPGQRIAAPTGFAGLCGRLSWACAGGGTSAAQNDVMSLARQVTMSVNDQVRQIADESQYGAEDYWSLPSGRGGDCEDLVLLKKLRLLRLGVAGDRLLIATVLDRSRQPHAVLVVRTEKGDYVLDNLTDRVSRWDRTGYSFIRMQDPNAPQRWSAVFAGGVFAVASL